MTALSNLAALAEEKVPGFKRSTIGRFSMRGGIIKPDNSPAALLMAVHLYVLTLEDDGGCSATICGEYAYGRFRTGSKLGTSDEMECTQEGIARAALVALLRAHGVEVAS